jgi:membrane protein implicated in regulation of membrane protease activity
MGAERNKGRIGAVTFVCVAVGLLVGALLLTVLGVAAGKFSGPVLWVTLVMAASGLALVAAIWGGVYDPSFGWIWHTPFGSGSLVGCEAEVRTQDMVFINGALWKSECEQPLAAGEKVKVVGVSGLTLRVKKLQ